MEDFEAAAKNAIAGLGKAAQPVVNSFVKSAQAASSYSQTMANARKDLENLRRQQQEAERRSQTARTAEERDRARRESDSLGRQAESTERSMRDMSSQLNERVVTTMAQATAKFSLGVDPFNDALGYMKDMMSVAGDSFQKIVDKTGIAGKLVGIFGQGIGKLSSTAIDLLIPQLQALNDSYRQVTSSGILLADGITGLAEMANEAGVGNVKQFAMALEGARPHIQNMGMTGGEAAARLTRTFGELRRGGDRYGERLTQLGYDLKDQGELIGMSMSLQRAFGQERAMNDKESAESAFELGKNLKILSDVTGKDAKAAMERARQETLRARVQATLQGDQLEAYNQVIAQTQAQGNEVMQRAITQMLGPAGRIIDQDLLLLTSQIPGLNTELEKMRDAVKSGADVQSVTIQTSAAMAKVREGALEFAKSSTGQGMILASELQNSNAQLKTFGSNLDKLLIPTANEAQTRKAVANANKTASDQADNLTKTFAEITESSIKQQRAITDMLYKPTQGFTDVVGKVTSGLATVAQKLNDFADLIPIDLTKYREMPSREYKERNQAPGGGGALPSSVDEAARRILERSGEPQRRAMGGLIMGGRPYMVGEDGPEVVVPRESGTVLPNTQLGDALSGGDRNFQNDMRSLLREHTMLLKSQVEVSRNLGTIMENLERTQARFVASQV